jgi:tetratricopeptide (TPR) repeat protein
MRRAFLSSLTFLALLLILIGCRSGGADLSKAESQRQFGVRMARMNLWREAMFRFRRAAEINPGDAMAHNNLAVALEANGDFEGAAKEYREALRLDRSNQYIQKNYSRYVEFTQRAKKREAKPATTTTTTTGEAPAAPPATATTPGDAPVAPPTTTTTTTTNPPEGGAQ